jgi:hypothetical protein
VEDGVCVYCRHVQDSADSYRKMQLTWLRDLPLSLLLEELQRRGVRAA